MLGGFLCGLCVDVIGCYNGVMVTGEAPISTPTRHDGRMLHANTLGGIAQDNPVNPVIVALARKRRPLNTLESVERHDAGAIGMPGCCPTILEAVAAQGRMHIAIWGDVEVASDEGG